MHDSLPDRRMRLKSSNPESIIIQFVKDTSRQTIDDFLRQHDLKVTTVLSARILQFCLEIPTDSTKRMLTTLSRSPLVKHCHPNRTMMPPRG